MSELFDMGKYGLYVWGSFGVTAIAVLWNWIGPLRERRQLLKQLAEHSDD